jgi:toxin-antitoxin system PIN domain toxin
MKKTLCNLTAHMIDLPDINVWLALVDERHVHHVRVRHYWEQESAEKLAFCRITMLGFLRLSTQARIMDNPLSVDEAWGSYRQFLALPLGCFLAEPLTIEVQFQALSAGSGFVHRLWTDSYLAAFAQASQCRLVSFDADFMRFPGLNFLHLAPLPPQK